MTYAEILTVAQGQPRLVIARSPLRVSFVGGGSDLAGPQGSVGATISSSIDKYVYAVAKNRNDSDVYLTWREKEVVSRASALKHDIVRVILESLGLLHGVEILTFADVPGVGSGLGSSAATTAAVLAACLDLKGRLFTGCDKQWFVESVCDVELNKLRRKGGRQDQYATVFGGLKRMEYECGAVDRITDMGATDQTRRLLGSNFALFSPGAGAEKLLTMAKSKPSAGRDAEITRILKPPKD